jgi:hypothetical protein
MSAHQTHRYVEVIWEDAVAHNETWVDLSTEAVPTLLVLSRGWLVHDDADDSYISIAASIPAPGCDDQTVGNVTSIPRGMIREMRDIKVSKPRQKKDKDATHVPHSGSEGTG